MTPLPDDVYTAAAFFARTRDARLQEAARIGPALQEAGVTAQSALYLDFVLYGRDPAAAEALSAALATRYATELRAFEPGGWMLVGTTRPFGARLDPATLPDWAAYLSDLAAAQGFVFSAWSVEVAQTGAVFASEAFEPRPAG